MALYDWQPSVPCRRSKNLELGTVCHQKWRPQTPWKTFATKLKTYLFCSWFPRLTVNWLECHRHIFHFEFNCIALNGIVFVKLILYRCKFIMYSISKLERSQRPQTSANAMLFARWHHHVRFGSGFPYAPFNAMLTKISKWSRIQDSFRITPKIEALAVFAIPDIPRKFQKDPSITFSVILLTDRQTDKLWQKHNLLCGGKNMCSKKLHTMLKSHTHRHNVHKLTQDSSWRSFCRNRAQNVSCNFCSSRVSWRRVQYSMDDLKPTFADQQRAVTISCSTQQ